MNFGFVINNRTCIGCHACSTACKSENEVPLGVYRTWVKYTETGTFPDSRRHFQVTRCNHCANPPCVRICPVTAMYQRTDGIVEFDKDQCIGCKACMQACPYDAIYVDPESRTVAKCHYCSHRTDIGLEPACVVVCPEHAIIAGDLDDPTSEISHVLAREEVSVRKPEQGTAPKVFYIEGNDVNLHPTAAERTPEQYMWADVVPLHAGASPGGDLVQIGGLKRETMLAPSGASIREPSDQGTPLEPIAIGGRHAAHMVQVGYNAQHQIPWHWQVPAYLVTKAIGAGIVMIAALGALFGWFELDTTSSIVIAGVSVAFIAATTGLLVADLERPERFLRVVLSPQWKSWLARGAYILITFSMVGALWLLLEAGAALELVPAAWALGARPWLLAIGAPLALGAAVYTAFLFGQAEGRDLWQNPLLPLHMLVQSLMAGAAALLVASAVVTLPAALATAAEIAFVVGLGVNLLMIALGELGMPHASEVAARAAHMMTHGRYKLHFWLGALVLGHVVAMLLMLSGEPVVEAVAALCALIGLYLYEHAFVMAPQELPNS